MQDVIIVGSGIAALIAARRLCEHKRVTIITKRKKERSNSWRAQGGVACAIADKDRPIFHLLDTMTAGCHHNDEEAVRLLVENGPASMKQLIRSGMRFDENDRGEIILGLEGAHRMKRILHAGGDATGRELIQFLLGEIAGKVTIIEDETVFKLVMDNDRCVGVETKVANEVRTYYAQYIILATGGAGSLYKVTSNDSAITGDGMMLAYRVGARLKDLEFMQFHPTMLTVDGEAIGLVSEAVRGEGAILVNEHNEPIMRGVHPLEHLAPRDVVSREIARRIQQGERVFLNIAAVANFAERFPTITEMCEEAGVQVTEGLLPVAPGAHFTMGGIEATPAGETNVAGLYALGEVAVSGVHGANRLASNSLLEGIVFGQRCAERILDDVVAPTKRHNERRVVTERPIATVQRDDIRERMFQSVGIVRDRKRLLAMKQWLETNLLVIEHVELATLPLDQIQVCNMLQLALKMTEAALLRQESRGGHYRSDYPATSDQWLKKQIIFSERQGITFEQLRSDRFEQVEIKANA